MLAEGRGGFPILVRAEAGFPQHCPLIRVARVRIGKFGERFPAVRGILAQYRQLQMDAGAFRGEEARGAAWASSSRAEALSCC